jgi:hypothetical protein
MPPIVTVPVAAFLFFVLRSLVGAASAPVFAGAVFGYLAYDLLHYACHAGSLRGRVARYLRSITTHHFRTPEIQFGASSPSGTACRHAPLSDSVDDAAFVEAPIIAGCSGDRPEV